MPADRRHLPELDVPQRSCRRELLRRDLRAARAVAARRRAPLHAPRRSSTGRIDTHMYPLGSCTMKLNPKVNDAIAAMPGFAEAHPHAAGRGRAGRARRACTSCSALLAEITGMADASLAPLAGAQGELAGVLVIKAYLESLGERRTTIARAGLRARHEPGDRVDGGLRRRRREAAARRRHGPRCAARGARRARPHRRGADDHAAQHARPLRPQHRPHRRDGARARRADVRRRREP